MKWCTKNGNLNTTKTIIAVHDRILDQAQIEEEIANDLWEAAIINKYRQAFR